jgi:hypothetical protein
LKKQENIINESIDNSQRDWRKNIGIS